MSKAKLNLQPKDYALRVTLEGNLKGRGTYVDTASDGDLAKILSAAFEVQANATPTTHTKKTCDLSATIEGLATGAKYAFRIRALGPNDLQSPWSDEVICMAP